MADVVQIKFGAQTGEAIADINQLNAEFKQLFTSISNDVRRMADTVESQTKRVNAELREMSQQGNNLTAAFGKMKGMAGGLLAGIGVMELGRALTSTVIEFERLKAVLETLEGDQADLRFEALQEFAKQTPYDLQQVVGAFALLKAQGLDPSNEALKSYGNTASAMGKSLDQMVQAVADASVGEMERLKEFGIVARQEGDQVTFIFNGVATTVKKNSQEIQQYLQNIGNTQFSGAMERQMNTLGGAFSNLKDNIASFAMAIGEAGFSSAMQELVTSFDLSGERADALARMLGETLGTAINLLSDIVKTLQETFNTVFDALNLIVDTFVGDTETEFSGLELIFKSVLSVVILFGSGFREVMATISAAISIVVSSLVGFAKVAAAALAFDFGAASAAWDEWKNGVVTAVDDAAAAIIESGTVANDRINALFTETPPPATGTLNNAPVPVPSGAAPAVDPSVVREQQRQLQEETRNLITELSYRQELVEDNFEEMVRLEDQKVEAIKKTYGEQSEEYREALRDRERLERAHNEQMARESQSAAKGKAAIGQSSLDNELKLLQQQFEAERAAIEQRFELQEISASEKAALLADVNERETQALIDHENRRFQIIKESLLAQLKLYPERSAEHKKVLEQIEAAEIQHAERMAILSQQQAQVMQANMAQITKANMEELKSIADPIASSFENMFRSVLSGQASFKDAMISMMDQLVIDSIMAIAKIPIEWASMEIAKTAASLFGIKTRNAAEATGAATSASINAAQATTSITANAATAASGAAASQAMIPFAGPALAAASAAAILALVMGFTKLVSASGGYDIPSGTNPLTQLHEEEMVLPKNIANPLRSMLSAPQRSNVGGMAAAAGDMVRSETNNKTNSTTAEFKYAPTINAGGNPSLESMLSREGAQMRRWLANQVRTGKLKVM